MKRTVEVLLRKTLLCLILVFTSVACQSVEGDSGDRLSESLSLDRRSVHRVRRTPLSASESDEVLAAHNRVRSLEGASDMQSLRWNKILGSMAEDWAVRCRWDHGQAKETPKGLGYSQVGQNLFAISGTSAMNLTYATLSWYNEKSLYHYDTMYCPPGKMCGHYTQVVWAETYEIGCAYTRCHTLYPSELTNALFLVCNYGPPGNFIGRKPFQKGSACSKCSTGQFWCSRGLCNRTCSSYHGPHCDCSLPCRNGAVSVSSNCSCRCADGWTGVDCSKVCRNYDDKCDPPSYVMGWPPSWCTHAQYGETVRESCPLMCKRCTVSAAATNEKTGSTENNVRVSKSTALRHSYWIIISVLLSLFNYRH